MNTTGYLTSNLTGNPPRCECHDCTQARWKMSTQGGIGGTTSYRQELQALKQQQAMGQAIKQNAQLICGCYGTCSGHNSQGL